MKKLALGALVGSVLIAAVPAFAADLNEPVPEAPVTYAPAPSSFDWTGAYVGATAGFGWSQRATNATGGNTEGFVPGVYAGYNYQIDPHWVIGGEADASIGPTATAPDWFGTARGRGGYAFDNILLYGTAGLAVGEGTLKHGGDKDSNTHVGYVVGGGIEAAVTRNITARAEYLYTDTNKKTYDVGGISKSADLDGSQVRLGLGYKF